MEARPVNRGPKRYKYGHKHLPMKVLISIRKVRITKDEYLWQYPPNTPIEQPPRVEIEQPPSVEELFRPDIKVVNTSKGSQHRSKGKVKGISRKSSNPHKQK